MSRPEYLTPTTLAYLRDAVAGKLPLYCSTCYRQVKYRGVVQALPNQYASAKTEHHEFHCTRCGSDVRIEVADFTDHYSWRYTPTHYDGLLRFAPPTDQRFKLVDQTDGARRFTSLQPMTADEVAAAASKKLAGLQ